MAYTRGDTYIYEDVGGYMQCYGDHNPCYPMTLQFDEVTIDEDYGHALVHRSGSYKTTSRSAMLEHMGRHRKYHMWWANHLKKAMRSLAEDIEREGDLVKQRSEAER